MLGIALSFGATAPLLTEPELALAADGSTLTVLPASNREDFQVLNAAPSQPAVSSAYHTVEPGESLWQIATQHDADVQVIKAANGIVADEVLRVGQVIRVPVVGMNDLVAGSGSARLALSSRPVGGVGGDMPAAADLLPTGTVPAVDDLEEIATLDEAELEVSELDKVARLEESANLSAAREADDLDPVASEGSNSTDIATTGLESQAVSPAVVNDQSSWSVAEAPSADTERQSQAVARLQDEAPAEESAVAEESVPPTSLPLHSEAVVQPRVAAPQAQVSSASSPANSDSKKDLVAAALSIEPAAVRSSSPELEAVRSYQVKQGDTLWSIASRNGVSLDSLLSHNHSLSRPEALSVGDRIVLPVASAPAEAVEESSDTASLATTDLATSPRTREQVISDHLARIRESTNALVDRDELNARIREARLELERSRNGVASNSETDSAPVSLEYHAPEPLASSSLGGSEPVSETALMVREGAQTPEAEWTVTDVASVVETVQDKSQQVATLQPEVEVADESPIQESPAQLDAAISGQLLAAAPLGADAYRVVPNLPVGQSVSPSMPMMPGASEFLPEAPSLSNGYIWPAQGTLTSGYGWRWGRMHRGVDIAAPVGTPIVAAAAGVVVQSGWNSGGYGNLVDIRHSDGSLTRYAHNSRLLVRQGEQVRQGQQIAAMGSTGYSTGPHLHFEVHLPSNGSVNPMAYLPGR